MKAVLAIILLVVGFSQPSFAQGKRSKNSAKNSKKRVTLTSQDWYKAYYSAFGSNINALISDIETGDVKPKYWVETYRLNKVFAEFQKDPNICMFSATELKVKGHYKVKIRHSSDENVIFELYSHDLKEQEMGPF